MLGKLMKAEWRATRRVFLPLIALLLVSAVMAAFGISYIDNRVATSPIKAAISTLSIVLYVAVAVGSVIVATILLIQRFYKHLLGDEGYLMFTLPVPVWQHIAAKGIIGTLWVFLSGIGGLISIFILFLGVSGSALTDLPLLFKMIGEGLQSLSADLGYSVFRMVAGGGLKVLIVGIITISNLLLSIYAAVSIGHLWSNHRIIGSVLAYFGVKMVGNVLSILLLPKTIDYIYYLSKTDGVMSFNQSLHYMDSFVMLGSAVTLLFSVILFFTTYYILRRRLNLE